MNAMDLPSGLHATGPTSPVYNWRCGGPSVDTVHSPGGGLECTPPARSTEADNPTATSEPVGFHDRGELTVSTKLHMGVITLEPRGDTLMVDGS